MPREKPSIRGADAGFGFPAALHSIGLHRQATPVRHFCFRRSRIKKDSLEFSFSGLKTALLYKLHAWSNWQGAKLKADLAAGYQEAIVTVLIDKAFMALKQTGVRALAVVGGVSANSRLRCLLQERALATDDKSVQPSAFTLLYGQRRHGGGSRQTSPYRRSPDAVGCRTMVDVGTDERDLSL